MNVISVIGLVSNQGTPNDTRVWPNIFSNRCSFIDDKCDSWASTRKKIPSKHNGKVESVKDKM